MIMMNKRDKNQAFSQKGQSMTELVILMPIFMILAVGMLMVHRLVTTRLSLMEEARLTAFEEAIIPKTARDLGVEGAPINYADNSRFKRSYGGRSAQKTKTVNFNPDASGMNDIFAENNILNNALFGKLSLDLVDTAQAASNVDKKINNQAKNRSSFKDEAILNERGLGIRSILERSKFGINICNQYKRTFAIYDLAKPDILRSSRCAEIFNSQFAAYLGSNLDYSKVTRDINYKIERGLLAENAISEAVKGEISNQFYSFFDTKVSEAISQGDNQLSTERSSAMDDMNSESIRLATDLRYLGSAMAVLAVTQIGNNLGSANSTSHSYNLSLNINETLVNGAFTSGADNYVIDLVNGFDYRVFSFIPLPSLHSMMAGIFEAVGKNAFFEEDDSVKSKAIDNSSVFVEATYDPSNTLGGFAKRISGAGHQQRTNFYLLTNEWQILRQNPDSSDHAYRSLGNQLDDQSLETEEAVLRRRVMGLYLLPSNLPAFLQPITDLIPGMSGVTSVLEGAGDIFGMMKSFVLNSPINDIIDFLDAIPFLDLSDFKLPEVPAVRPMVYPSTTEIKNDKLACISGSCDGREFSNYLNEQDENDPNPRPVYDEDQDDHE